MNRAKAVLTALRLVNSAVLTRSIRSQVTHFPPHHYYLSSFNSNLSAHFLRTHQSHCYSSTPNSVLQLVLTNQWSTELETELSESHPLLTHDAVIYVLRRLGKDPQKASHFFNWVCEKNGFSPTPSVFSLILRVLMHRDTMRQFWATLTKMKDLGFYIDVHTYVTILEKLRTAKMEADVSAFKHFYESMVQDNAGDEVVKNVVNVVLGSDWSDKVEKQLEELKILLSDNFVVRVLWELRARPTKALSFFNWVGQCSGYGHSSVTYNAIARVLGQEESIGEFWGVIDEMKAAGVELDLDTYIKVSRKFQKSKMIEDAVILFELMMDGPYKPSAQDCTLLLRSVSRSGNLPDLDLVYRVAKKFEASGNTLSKPVYDGIHRSLTSVGKFDEAEDLLQVMRNAGLEPDNITYSQLVFGLCKAKKLEEACKVLDDMEASGCVPDVKTWTILIFGHCAANEVDKALICFTKMMEKQCEADAELLHVLINGLITQTKVDGAYNLLIEMLNTARLKPWQHTFKILIENLLGARRLEEAMKLLHLMKKQGYPPYPEPFVQYISKSGSVEDAVDFLDAFSEKENPSSAAYVHVFKLFFKEGRHSEASDLLYKCPPHIRKVGEIQKLFGSTGRSKTTDTTCINSGMEFATDASS